MMSFEEIAQVLPHRYPFLLIDRVVELEPGRFLKAFKNVTANEPFFVGHFPGFAVMPGVLQIEAMAQAAGLLASKSGEFDKFKHAAFLAGVDGARFRRLVVPGDRLDIEIELVSQKRALIKAKAKTKVSGETASEAELLIAVQNRMEQSDGNAR